MFRRGGLVGAAAVALLAACMAATALADSIPGLSPGATVRITPPKRVEIPGVIALEPGLVAGSFKREGDLVAIHSGDQLLYLPVPGKVLRGEYAGVRGESILIRRSGSPDPIAIPRQAIARLEIQTSKGHALAGVLGGALVGFGIGCVSCELSHACKSWVPWPLAGAFLALPGALAGGAIGSIESWEVVSTDRLQVSFALLPGTAGQRMGDRRAAGVAMVVRLRF